MLRGFGFAIAMSVVLAPPIRAHDGPAAEKDFRGVWAGNGSVCRSPDEFLLMYERDTASFPYRSSLEPDRSCRILWGTGKWPVWKLRLRCTYPDPAYRLPKPFEVSQTLRLSADGMDMVVETGPVLGQPARVEDTVYCRQTGEEPPPLRCISPKTGRVVECEP